MIREKRFGAILLALAAALCWGTAASATGELPLRFSYEGRLTDAAGLPLTNPSVTVEFALYDALSGGTQKWPSSGSESHTVSVENGLFSVLVGSIAALNEGVFADSLFLEVSVNDGRGLETLSPRQALVSVPYAIVSGVAAGVDNGADADVALKRNGVAKASLTSSGLSVNGAISASNIGGTGAGQIVVLDGAGRLPAVDGSLLTGINGGGGGDGGSNSLDGAYDQGGSGAGRIIVADAGPVQIQGTSGLIVTGGPVSIAPAFSSASSVALGVVGQAFVSHRLRVGAVFSGAESAALEISGSMLMHASNVPGRDGKPLADGTAGTFLVWLPQDAALRVGKVNGAHWDQSNIGSASTVAGGEDNAAQGGHSFVGGGQNNAVTQTHTTVGGGFGNTASGPDGFVGGGRGNTASGSASAVGGGSDNVASNNGATVGGGGNNAAYGIASAVAGGSSNTAAGDYSFAGGNKARASHNGAFVWADNQGTGFTSTNTNQFLVRAQHGAAINTNSPATGADLTVGVVAVSETLRVANIKFTDNTVQNTAGGTDSGPGEGVHNTLDQAYDQNGAGAGRVITADAGAVQVAGSGGLVVDGALQVGPGSTPGAVFSVAGTNAAATHRALEVTDNASASLLAVRNDGFVGIGSTAPSSGERFNVAGTVEVTGLRITASPTAGHVLTADASGNATWEPATGGGNTLDGAYDQGGSGAGRTITADGGAVEVAGTDGLVVSGTFGSGAIPATGAGTRMQFYPNKAAFRAGAVSGTQWDDSNIGNYSTVAGGQDITASGSNATVSGGKSNTATSQFATVAGGQFNAAIGDAAVVGGGSSNQASGQDATVSGGSSNTASGAGSTVGGGATNTASGVEAVIAGGGVSVASGDYAAVGGGLNNAAYGVASVVAGGESNTAVGNWSFAAGKQANAAYDNSFVWADGQGSFASTNTSQFLVQASNGVAINTATPAASTALTVNGTIEATNLRVTSSPTVGHVLTADTSGNATWQPATGGGNTLDGAYDQGGSGAGRTITADGGAVEVAGTDGFVVSGTFASGAIPATGAGTRMQFYPSKSAFRAGTVSGTQWDDSNIGNYSTVAGGQDITASGSNATVSGGKSNTATSQFATVAGGQFNAAIGDAAVVGGGSSNQASGQDATVSGGSSNTASGAGSTVGGGATNTASGVEAVIAGGGVSVASGDYAAVGGGLNNAAYGVASVVAGGESNTASGGYSAVPGGAYNEANGEYSFASGRRAKADNAGAFVWADATDADFASSGDNQFLIRAGGGVAMGHTNPSAQLHVQSSESAQNDNLANHITIVENTDAGIDGDVLALKSGAFYPEETNHFITMFDGSDIMVGRVEGNGNGGIAFTSGSGDFAEFLKRIDINQEIGAGQIVGVAGGFIGLDMKSPERYMVVSDQAIVVGNAPGPEEEHLYEKVAFVGQVRVWVNGPVRVGDYVLASGRGDGFGIARAAEDLTNADLKRIVGRAWESSGKKGAKRINTVVGLPQDPHLGIAQVMQENQQLKEQLQSAQASLQQTRDEMRQLRQGLAAMQAAVRQLQAETAKAPPVAENGAAVLVEGE